MRLPESRVLGPTRGEAIPGHRSPGTDRPVSPASGQPHGRITPTVSVPPSHDVSIAIGRGGGVRTASPLAPGLHPGCRILPASRGLPSGSVSSGPRQLGGSSSKHAFASGRTARGRLGRPSHCDSARQRSSRKAHRPAGTDLDRRGRIPPRNRLERRIRGRRARDAGSSPHALG